MRMEQKWSTPVIVALVVAILGAIPSWLQAYTSWEQLRIMQASPVPAVANTSPTEGAKSEETKTGVAGPVSVLPVALTSASAVISMAALVFIFYRISRNPTSQRPGLRIIAARWYCSVFPKYSQNITKAIQAQALGRESIELRAHQDAGWGDICARHGGVGHHKLLEVDFTYSGHAVIPYDHKQTIPPLPTTNGLTATRQLLPSRRPALTIHSALYGVVGTRFLEYKSDLEAKIECESLNVPIDNSTFNPDPFHGELKRARIIYSCGAAQNQKVIRREYSQLILPPDWEMWLEGVAAVLARDCATVADSYEKLKRNYPDDKRVQQHPRNNNSWPHPGGNWDYVALWLYSNNRELERIEEHAKMLWSRMSLNTTYHALPNWGSVNHVDDLIVEIRKFRSGMLWMVSEEV